MAASYFLLLAQKKVTKEKGTLGFAPSPAARVRCGRTGSAHRASCPVVRIGAIPRAARASRGFSVHPPPLLRGEERRARTDVSHISGASAAGTAALCSSGSPLGRGEQVEEIAACGARGRAQDARAFDESTGTCSRRTPEPAREVCRQGCRQTASA